jgi:DNA-binding Lrp family transcriptional regulator
MVIRYDERGISPIYNAIAGPDLDIYINTDWHDRQVAMAEFDPLEYRLLVQNPRISYRDLASKLGLSTPQLFNRLQDKYRSGSLYTFTTISTNYLNATMVTVFGIAEMKRPMQCVIDDLRNNGCVCFAGFCSGNMVIVTGLLHHPSDMEPFLRSISKICQLKKPTLAIDSLGRIGDSVPFQSVSTSSKLSELDLQIISSLHNNVRKSNTQVAKEVGSSVKTVKRHIDRMIQEGLIETWVLGDPAVIHYVSAATYVYIGDGVDGDVLGREIIRRFPDQVYAYRRYCNLPQLISLSSSHETASKLDQMLSELKTDDRILDVVPNVFIKVMVFDTWREGMLPKLENGTSQNE